MCGASPSSEAQGTACCNPTRMASHDSSRIKTLVGIDAVDATSNPASRIDVATYFATEPKPVEF